MEEFIKNHKADIVIAAGLVLAYSLGRFRGYQDVANLLIRTSKEVAKTVKVTKF